MVQGPLKVWLQSAELADKAQALGAFCRFGTSLPPRLSELAILVMGAHWQAGFEWAVHAKIARAAGLDEKAIEAIRRGEKPALPDAPAQAVHAFSFELLSNRRVSDVVYATAMEVLGQKAVVELVGLLGYYTLISMTIVAFDVPLPEGVTNPVRGSETVRLSSGANLAGAFGRLSWRQLSVRREIDALHFL